MVLNYKKGEIKMKLILSIFGAIIICMNITYAKDLTQPKLKYEMTAKLYLEAPMPIEANQTIFSVVAEGSYIKLSTGETWEVLSPCADWGYISANGTVELDVRCTAKAEDGSFVRIDYKGRAKINENGVKKIETSEVMTAPNDMYFITALTIQTQSEKYSWMNDIVFTGKGELQWWNDKGIPAYVEYTIYSVSP